MSKFIQSETDKKMVNFFKQEIPELLEKFPEAEALWHKYKKKASIKTKEEVDASYEEMQKLLDIFDKFLLRILQNHQFDFPRERKKLSDKGTTIVMYWHQGTDLPDCTKLCKASFEQNQSRPFMFLTFEDIKKLVKLDDYILQLMYEGKMTLATFSDYVRCCLIEEYNCIWVDSTVFCIDELPESYFEADYWSLNGDYLADLAYNVRALTYDCHFGQTYILGGKDTRIFSIVRQIIEFYYHKYDINFSYFIVYCMFEFLYRHDEEFKQIMDRRPKNNSHIEYLTCQRDEPYSDELHQRILSSDTQLYKLSNRVDYDYNDTTKMLSWFVHNYVKEI